MPAELLQVENVRFSYPETAWELQGVSFGVRAGEVLAIIGPNGSGKSTLLKCAAGILAPGQGCVRMLGGDMAQLDRRDVAKSLGYLPQSVQYAFDYTVEEVVGMGRFPHLSGLGFLSTKDLAVIERCMTETETLPYRSRTLSHLSGGERQRAFLASVLAQEPSLLLLDEPTAALDIHHQAQFFRLLRQLAGGGIGVAVVTHDLNIASFYCTRLLLMAGGHTVCEGSPEEVLRQESLTHIYGESVVVDRDPRSGRPIVLPGGAL